MGNDGENSSQNPLANQAPNQQTPQLSVQQTTSTMKKIMNEAPGGQNYANDQSKITDTGLLEEEEPFKAFGLEEEVCRPDRIIKTSR